MKNNMLIFNKGWEDIGAKFKKKKNTFQLTLKIWTNVEKNKKKEALPTNAGKRAELIGPIKNGQVRFYLFSNSQSQIFG